MSGMSKSFKLPSIIKKRKAVSHGLPTFDLGKVTNLRELGFGSFVSVYLWDYVCGVEIQSVVVKKLRGESEDAKRRFVKEAKLLNGIKHPNIPSFLEFSDVSYALMMEYVAFDLDQATVLLKVLILAFLCIFLAFSKVSAFFTNITHLHNMEISSQKIIFLPRKNPSK